MTKINILVTAAGGAVGQGIIKAIKLSKLNCRIVSTDAQKYSAGLYRGDAGYLVPLSKSPEFIDKIIDICNKESINAICIGTDLELRKFAENRKKIEDNTGARVIVSSPEIIRIASDKWETYKFLKENKISAPRSLLPDDKDSLQKSDFPLMIKPRVGTSSEGTQVVNNINELDEAISKIENLIIQEYLPQEEKEYTSTTLTFDGKCYGVLSMNRTMRFGGHTTKAIIDDYHEYNREIAKITEKLNPFGPCNFQWRLTDTGPTVFEINGRFSGTTPFCAEVGFNTVEASLRHIVLGEKIEPLKLKKKGIILRYFNEVYVPFEECQRLSKEGHIQKPKSEINKCF